MASACCCGRGTGTTCGAGSEFPAKAVREWLGRVGVRTLFIEPGSPWENGYIESFNVRLRDELLSRSVRAQLHKDGEFRPDPDFRLASLPPGLRSFYDLLTKQHSWPLD